MPQGIGPTSVDKAWIAADPAAALVGYGSTILAVFGVFDAIGLDADQVAILAGSVLGVMGSVRMMRERNQRQKLVELRVRHQMLELEHTRLQKETGSPIDDGLPVVGSESAQDGPESPEPPSASGTPKSP